MKQQWTFPVLVAVLIQWLLIALPVQAGLFDSANPFASDDGPVDVEQAFVMQAAQENERLKLSWEIKEGYYLYRDRIKVEVPAPLEVADIDFLEAEEKDDPLFGRVWVYHNQAEASFRLKRSGEQAADSVATISYQGCWEGGICYPPVSKTIPLSMVPDRLTSEPEQTLQANNLATAASRITETEQDRFARMLGEGGLLLTIGAFFLAGLALSLTPCVFPMIPILSSIIAGQGDKITTMRSLTLSAVYVLAVSVTYTVAGVIAGLFGENLQAMFQNGWIIGSFSLLFVLLAMSMFGFYELQLPSSWQARLSQMSNSQQGGTLSGVAVMGLLSALIVGPCMAAPLAGALIYIGQSGDPLMGGLALFSLSIGMGVPLLLIGVSAGKLLPKAGAWMSAVKAAFGVMLLLMAIWMLDRIVATEVTMVLTAAVLITAAVYMKALDRLPETAGGWSRFWKGGGVIVMVYGVALLIGAMAGNRSMLHPLQGLAGGVVQQQQKKLPFDVVRSPQELQPLLAQAKAAGEPVMLDFYADWCVSCIELEVVTFADENVMQALQSFRLIKVDVTANDEGAKALYKEYGIIGPPALIFYDSQGNIRTDMTYIGVAEPQAFVQHLARVQ
ncbi:protein-disulfide reductase DsbD [Marinobacterium jannaschii]|uniref:protein-disulfide reductase DsbD n=1 Tax=Marinobacterium jannaschii TaxID=64970 RepID=UPI0004866A57|nr:protein-disulfide reductase DsbD [Marinobacterium jannaschii]